MSVPKEEPLKVVCVETVTVCPETKVCALLPEDPLEVVYKFAQEILYAPENVTEPPAPKVKLPFKFNADCKIIVVLVEIAKLLRVSAPRLRVVVPPPDTVRVEPVTVIVPAT